MNCDKAIEFLPWLLNGTLEAGERDEVQGHLKSCERCREALAETRSAWSSFTQHIPTRDLAALAWGEAPAEIELATAEEHLASCPQCAADLELARMSRRLEEESNVAVFPQVRTRPAAGESPRSWRAAAIAAGLAAVVASMGWIQALHQPGDAERIAQAKPPAPAAPAPRAADGSLQKQVEDLVARLTALQASQQQAEQSARENERQLAEFKKQSELPRASAFAILDTAAVVRGSEAQEAPETKAVHPSSLPFTLLLQGAKDGEEGAGGRRAEIADAAGTSLRVEGTLPKNDQGYYALTLPAGFLKPGHRYTIRLQGSQSGKTRETYEIRAE
jgi:hypothetical protein